MGRKQVLALGVAGLVLGCWVGGADAQAIVDGGGPTSYPAPDWMARLLPDPEDPYWQAYAAQCKLQRETKQEMLRFRRDYFSQDRTTETRQVGMSLLRERYNQAGLYPLLLEVFEHDDDVRLGLLDMFVETATPEADATLAWEAVFDRDAGMRAAARVRLLDRIETVGGVSDQIKLVIGAGLQKEVDSEVIAAAGLAEVLRLYEMVPLLIAAQVGGGGGGGGGGAGGERAGNLGYIVIAQQQSFVSDLQPVVANSAVGFDPTLSVVTEGVVLEVSDAVVITYRTEVFYSLTRMTTDALGRPTGGWGMDPGKWWDWYAKEWKPWMAARAEG